MRSFAQNIQVEVFSHKLYCWKDGGKVSDFLWFLVHSFCHTLDFDDEGFCSLVTSISSCGCQCWSTCSPLWSRPKRWWWCENTWISFELFPNVHPIPHFQVPSYPSEQTCKELRNEIGRPSEDSHVSSVIDCVCVNKTWPDVSNLPSSPVVICGGPPTLSITGTSVTCLTETEKHKQSQIIHNFTLSIK